MDIASVQTYKVIPVVVINHLEETCPTLENLQKGGLPIAEITFRTACAKEAIALGVKHFPAMLIGAGTVINAEQCKQAISVGAKFIVGPGFSEEVADVCLLANIPYFPGCVTPTEIMMALNKGITILKFFPANVYGGLPAMKALSGPFPQVKFIPTGGIGEGNLAEYLAWDKIHAVGGSWMMKGNIQENCQTIAKIVKNSKK